MSSETIVWVVRSDAANSARRAPGTRTSTYPGRARSVRTSSPIACRHCSSAIECTSTRMMASGWASAVAGVSRPVRSTAPGHLGYTPRTIGGYRSKTELHLDGRLSGMKWKKPGVEEYGFPPSRAVMGAAGQRPAVDWGRAWQSEGMRGEKRARSGPPSQRGQNPGTPRRARRKAARILEAVPRALRAGPRTARVVRSQADAAAAEHREARRRWPRA